MQNTSHLLMIRPVRFEYNAQTAVNNSFQTAVQDDRIAAKAMQEFDEFVSVLTNNGIDVTVVEDSISPHTPDSVFPNNWISFHEDESICLYPMFAENRRAERKQHVLEIISEKFSIHKKIDLSKYEEEGIFLEGTGSMVFDRDQKIAYACLSPRTDQKLLEKFCALYNYTPISFVAVDAAKQPIYHSNVLMCVADAYVVICLDSIADPAEKKTVMDTIISSGKEIIDISLDQMNHFAGNMLQLINQEGEKLLVMSTQAFTSLGADQLDRLLSFNRIIHSDISNIETNGGGSARCMMAEIFLPLK